MPRNDLQFAGNHIVVIGAHPDDDVIGCGGTLVRLTEAGNTVSPLYITSGENGNWDTPPAELESIRQREAAAAAELLGYKVQPRDFLGFTDGSVRGFERNRIPELLVPRLVELAPDVVLVTHGNDGHPDHESTARATLAAVRDLPRRPRVYGYEVWEPIARPTHYTDISNEALERKITAMKAHGSQTKKRDYIAHITERAAQRGHEIGVKAAEAFVELSLG